MNTFRRTGMWPSCSELQPLSSRTHNNNGEDLVGECTEWIITSFGFQLPDAKNTWKS